MNDSRLAGPGPRALALAWSLIILGLAGCREVPSSPSVDAVAARGGRTSTGPVVRSVVPGEAPRNITIDLTVTGSGFDQGSVVTFEKDETPVSGITTNSTAFVSSTKLVANVTIDADASPDQYDVVVTATGGKRGIGVEQFEVLDVLWIGSLDGERLFQSTRINALGHATGWSATTPFYWSEDTGPEWVWNQPTWWAYPVAINDADQVAGYTCGVAGQTCGYAAMYGVIWARSSNGSWQSETVTGLGEIPSDLTNDGVLFFSRYQSGGPWTFWRKPSGQTPAQLPVPPGNTMSASMVFANNTGQAAGGNLFWSFAPSSTSVIQLPAPPGGTDPAAADIADLTGDVVFVTGSATFSGLRQPVRWHLSPSGGSWSVAAARLPLPFGKKPSGQGYGRGVNGFGDVVGFAYDSRGTAIPIKWSLAGVPGILPHPGGNANAEAFSINNAGWITGYVEAPYEGAVVWRP